MKTEPVRQTRGLVRVGTTANTQCDLRLLNFLLSPSGLRPQEEDYGHGGRRD